MESTVVVGAEMYIGAYSCIYSYTFGPVRVCFCAFLHLRLLLFLLMSVFSVQVRQWRKAVEKRLEIGNRGR